MSEPLRDLISAILLTALGVVGFVSTYDFADRAAAWPRWMWGALVVFSLMLLLEAANAWRRGRR